MSLPIAVDKKLEERAYTTKTLLICGSRDFNDWNKFEKTLDDFFNEKQRKNVAEKEKWMIVHGACATGADQMAQKYADLKKLNSKSYPAEWTKHGLAAGPLRNGKMVEGSRPHAAIAFKAHAISKGTDDCLRRLHAYSQQPNSRLWSITIVN